MKILSLFLILLCFLPAAAAQEANCPALPSRLDIGYVAQVTPGSPNRLRAEPSTSAEQIGSIPAENAMTILDGPTCANGVLWWQVDFQGVIGWTAEIVSEDYALSPIMQHNFEGVHFAAPDVGTFTPSLVPEEITGSSMPTSNPEYIEFLLNNGFPQYGVWVYPLDAYAQLEPVVAEIMFWLEDLLEDRPALDDMTELPYVLQLGAAQDFVGRAAYVDGANISGIHYLTHFAQALIPFQRDSLAYTFQGITNDGAYYVSMRVPVTVDVLPETGEPPQYNANESELDTERRYLEGIRVLVQNAPPESVQPSMETLSQMALTLTIEPGILLDSAPVTSETESPMVMGIACEREDFPPRLSIGSAAEQTLPENVSYLPKLTPGGEGAGWSISRGGVVGVLAGPVCADDVNFWLVYEFERGWSGWIAESWVFFEDNAERYFFEPVEAPAEVPEVPTGECAIISLFNAAARVEPNFNADFAGYLIGGTFYPVDSLLMREEGGFAWWQLPAGLTLSQGAEQLVIDTPVWVQVDKVFATSECEGLSE